MFIIHKPYLVLKVNFQIVQLLILPKTLHKTDQRVTGSDVIDSSLQEIFGYIIRDYITPWYHLISNDTEFPDKAVKKSGQSLAINVSNRYVVMY